MQPYSNEATHVVYISEQPAAPVEMLAEYGDLLSIADLQELTGLAANTLRREITSGRLPGCKIGSRLYVGKDVFLEHVRGGVSNASK